MGVGFNINQHVVYTHISFVPEESNLKIVNHASHIQFGRLYVLYTDQSEAEDNDFFKPSFFLIFLKVTTERNSIKHLNTIFADDTF